MIEIKGLHKNFSHPSGDLPVLKGIDLSIKEGQMIALMGASGVGKSTLLHVMGALDRPTSGTVLYDGVDIFRLSETGLVSFRNKKIGFVFQFHHLLPEFSAIENVIMPGLLAGDASKAELKKRAAGLLGELGLARRLHHRPGELSGGEQQRVAVARALFMSPSVILADEPTGNLDAGTGRELFDLLLSLNKKLGITFVIATHDMGLAEKCGHIVNMVDGAIAAKPAAA
ncbi:MAG: ABC transporter ATP-binding protein [Actinomycetota bacterium]|nr:ABC transporter ATP-binding protein [Actinomycetota bacterium]